MPTYSYECKRCGHTQDMFHSMSAKPRVKCEACGGPCARLIGKGAGIIFKGSGFYETDYKNKKGKTPASESKPTPTKSEATSEKKSSESKPSSSGSESKPEPAAKAS